MTTDQRVSTGTRGPLRGDIQALRALAVTLVTLYHADVPGLTGGYIGVDVFFVISGFLISGHLLDEFARTKTINFTRFYARRIRRLIPAALLVVAVTLAFCRYIVPPLTLPGVSADGRSAALLFSNVRFALNGIDYLGNQDPSPFQQYWSLSLEEQFYIVWPALLLILLIVSRRVARLLPLLLGVVVVVSFAASVYLTSWRQPVAFFLLPSRVWEFGLGALAALALRRGLLSKVAGRTRNCATILGFALVLVCGFWFTDRTPFPGSAAALPALGTALVLAFGPAPARLLSRVVDARPVQFIGKISYSIYLWHWPLLTVATYGTGRTVAPAQRALEVALCVPLAWLTYVAVENPIRNSTTLRASSRRSFSLAVAALIAVTGVSVLTATLPTLHASETALPLNRATTANELVASPEVPANLNPSLRAAAGDVPSLYSSGCQANFAETVPKGCVAGDSLSTRSMVLFGDSHAAQWYPALDLIAKSRDLRLVTFTKSACPSVTMTVYNKFLVRNYTECDTWRRAAITAIRRMQPAVIVLSNYGTYNNGHRGSQYQRDWGSALAKTMSLLPASAERVLIGDTPHFDYEMPNCLSAHLTDTHACAKARSAVIPPQHRATEIKVARAHGYRYIDSTVWTCPKQVCVGIQRNLLLYRDQQHLTATYVVAVSPLLAAQINKPGAPRP